MPPEPDFMDQALCAGQPVHLFFPDEGRGHCGPDSYNKGRTVCVRCPVRVECLDYAIAAGEKYGLWGGESPADRKKIARERRREHGKPIPVCGTRGAYERHMRLGEEPDALCRAANNAKNRSRRGAA